MKTRVSHYYMGGSCIRQGLLFGALLKINNDYALKKCFLQLSVVQH